MRTFSIQVLFFIAFISTMALISCGKVNNDVIPYSPVDFTIDLLDPEFVNLSVIGISDTIDASTNNWGDKSAGYDGNGIIIYSGPEQYYAYDRTCPYDFAVNDLSIKVKIDLPAVAVCPHCGTKYSLSTYGTPLSGSGRYPLKNYKTSFDENRYIRVWNE
jgi:nitrite reductase/ring-hydroxylating ferredoxin subunit